MPKQSETTTKFKVDISELKAGMQEAERSISLATSEFKASTAGMDAWGKSADGLGAKVKQLDSTLTSQKTILSSLEQQHKFVAQEQGENSKGAQDLMIKINNQKAAIGQTESQLRTYNTKLEDVKKASQDVGKETEQTKSALDNLKDTISTQDTELAKLKTAYANLALEQGKDSDEAKNLAREIQDLSEELSKNKTKLSDADYAADNLGDALDAAGQDAKESQGGFSVLKGALANLVSDGIKSVISGLKEMAEESREYRKIMGSLDVSSQQAGYSAENTAEIYKQLYGVLADDQTAATTTANLQALGLAQDDLTNLTNGVIGAWAKYGDSIPIDGLAEAVNETLKVGQVTGGFADVLNWAGVSEDEFNEKLAACSTEVEKANLITQAFADQGLNKAGQAWQESNKSLVEANQATSDYQKATAELGETIEPVLTEVKKGFTELLKSALDLTGSVNFEELAGKIKTAFKEGTDALKGFVTFITENKSVIISAIAGIAAGFAVFKIVSTIVSVITAIKSMVGTIVNLSGAFKKAFDVVKLIKPAITGLFSLIAANPVIAIIVGIIAVITLLWTKCEWFRNGVMSAFEAIKAGISSFVSAFVNFFTVTIPNAFSGALTAAGNFISGFINFFVTLPERISILLQAVISAVVTWVSNMVAKAVEAGSQFVSNIIKFITELPYKIGYVLGLVIGNVVKFGANLIKFATTEIPKFITNVIKFISQLPSKFATWLTNTITKVVAWGANLISTGKQKASDFINGVISFIQQLPSKFMSWLTKTITNVGNWGKDLVNKGKENATSFVSKVIDFVKQLPEKLANAIKGAIDKVVTWGTNLAAKGTQAATDLFNAVVNGIASLPSKMVEIGGNIVNGVWNGIQNAAGQFATNIRNFFSGLVDGAKEALGIHSPSRVFRDAVGVNIVKGVATGVINTAKTAVNAVENLCKSVFTKAKDGTNKNDYAGIGTSIVDSIGKSIDDAEYKNGIEAALIEATKNLNELGAQAMRGFLDGMTSQTKNIKSGIKLIIDSITKDLQINGSLSIDGFKNTMSDFKTKLSGSIKTGNKSESESGGSTQVVNNFYQTNNSPKSLSRLDIYRQTKNALAFAK